MKKIAQDITLLDGGMGQELLKRSGSAPTPMWSAQVLMDKPDIVRDLHIDYIRAGARVITLNSYSATPERLARDVSESLFEDLQNKAIEVAKAARELAGIDGVRIAGCLPPLYASYRPDIAPEFDVMLRTYQRVVAVQKSAVDLFLCETMASMAEARAAASASLETGLPVWCALTVEDDTSAKLRNGDALTDAVSMLDQLGVHATLINCSKPEAISAAWDALCSGEGQVGAYANGFTSISALEPGGTVDSLEARHDLNPENYAKFVMQWVERGASIVGGCCEVGPAHIALIAKQLTERGLTNR